ncbi:G-protein coupled receptor [Dermatophagoides farinae]|uniref:G-protein coupled receptor n=1 Tax=Dermatophagoides farinae TaxID=6954 RepID=A0A922HTN0_DERFA|nr:G-protein coupled receptor [Dermatophagoides farinae]
MPLLLSLLATFTQFLLPLGMTTILYSRIGRIIAQQGKLAKHYCNELNRRIVDAKRKRITMLVLIVVGFLITWLPLTMYHLLIDFHIVYFHWNIFLTLHIWAMTSVCYNSFIYCFMNEDFRKRSKQIIAKHQRSFMSFCFIFLFINRKSERHLGAGGGGGGSSSGGDGAGAGTTSTGSVSAQIVNCQQQTQQQNNDDCHHCDHNDQLEHQNKKDGHIFRTSIIRHVNNDDDNNNEKKEEEKNEDDDDDDDDDNKIMSTAIDEQQQQQEKLQFESSSLNVNKNENKTDTSQQ